MAEWSKATDSSSVLFGGVSSNLTGCIYIYIYFLLFLLLLIIYYIYIFMRHYGRVVKAID